MCNYKQNWKSRFQYDVDTNYNDDNTLLGPVGKAYSLSSILRNHKEEGENPLL